MEEHVLADGTTVLKGSDGTLYDLESFDAIGKWNSEDNTLIDDENIAARNEFLFNAYHYFSIEKIENFEQGEYFNDTEIVIAVKEKEE